jgi:hypothetical protein
MAVVVAAAAKRRADLLIGGAPRYGSGAPLLLCAGFFASPMPRYFTLEEANDLLCHIKPLMGHLLKRRARLVQARPEVEAILEDLQRNFGGAAVSEATQDMIMIEKLAAKIREHGCVLKDLNAGLVDFLAERDGREVYLCWRYGEPEIKYYHELNTGYADRQRF